MKLLKLILELADKESKGQSITPPSLISFIPNPTEFVSKDPLLSGKKQKNYGESRTLEDSQ